MTTRRACTAGSVFYIAFRAVTREGGSSVAAFFQEGVERSPPYTSPPDVLAAYVGQFTGVCELEDDPSALPR